MCTCARFRQSSIQSHRCSASGYLQFYPTELYPLFSLGHKPSWCKLNQLWFGSDSALHLIYISVFFQDSQILRELRGDCYSENVKNNSEQNGSKCSFVLTLFCNAGQRWLACPVCCCIHSSGWLMHWGTRTAGKETVNQRREQRVEGHTGCSN